MADEPRWGPATTYRASPHLRRQPPAPRPRRGGAEESYDAYDESIPEEREGTRHDSRHGRRGYREAPQPEPEPRRRGGRRAGVVALLLLVVIAVAAYPIALAWVGYSSIHRIGAMPASSLADTPGRTVLLVGTDSRANLTRDQQVQLSTGGDAGGDRTDTIMLLHRPANGGPVVLLSIPRDSYVAIPGHGRSKINAAYSWGGPALMISTVEAATGIKVDGYAETGLGGFAGLVDAVGGVTMCPSGAIKDPKAGLDIPAGCQLMNGATALGYARSRDFDPNGDLGRAERQRQLIGAIAKKAATPATLANPVRAFSLAKAGGGALSVDDSFGAGDLYSFVQAMRSVAGGSAISLNVPVATASLRTSSGLAIAWDANEAQQVFTAIRTDDTASLAQIAASEPAVKAAAG